MASIAGRRVVVLGGSQGIGLATARLALDRAADVVIASRSRDNLDAAHDAIGECEAYTYDAADEGSVVALFERVGTLDHLLITAAVLGTGTIADTPKATLQANVDTRLWGHYFATKHAAPRISRDGSMTFMSGVSTRKCLPGTSMLAASQAAVEVFGRHMAAELAPIRVNTLVAGGIHTPGLDKHYEPDVEAEVAKAGAALPVGRLGRPEEVAELALFVMSCEFMTGSTVLIDGGQLLL